MVEGKYTRQYCIDNKVIIECKTLEELKTITKVNFTISDLKKGELRYVVLTIRGFNWQPTYNKQTTHKDYFKKQFPNSETISASVYLRDNNLLKRRLFIW